MNRSIVKYKIRNRYKNGLHIHDNTMMICADLLMKKIIDRAIKNNIIVANSTLSFEVVEKQKSIFDKKEKILVVHNKKINENNFSIKLPIELQNKIDSSLIPYRNVSQ